MRPSLLSLYCYSTGMAVKALKNLRKLLFRYSQLMLRYLALIVFAVLIYEMGFYHSEAANKVINYFYFSFLVLTAVALLSRATFVHGEFARLRAVLSDLGIFLLVVTVLCVRYVFNDWLELNSPGWLFLGSSWMLHLVVVMLLLLELSRSQLKLASLSGNPALLFIMSFVTLILFGAGLLLLPRSTVSGISVVDAFFTSTSAVCVTGLTVIDTATQFTMFGKSMILILIQLGGLGVMTFTTFFALLFRGGSSVRDQLYLKDYMNVEKLSDVVRTLLKIVIVTIGFELVGAIGIYFSLDSALFPTMGDKVWFSVFHSISAFCNAGFSTMTKGLYEEGLRFNYYLHMIISVLIILGGLGFPIVFNFTQLVRHRVKKWFSLLVLRKEIAHIPRIININTKLVVITTASLLAAGWVLFFISEYRNVLAEHPWYGKLAVSFFGSVTPRTAGFNAFDVGALTTSTILVYLLLMWIGASPGSTGGGIKTTTFAVAVMNAVSVARGKDRVEMGRREIAPESVKRAFALMLMSFLVIGMGVFLVSMLEPEQELLHIAFECFSAFSTVGLTLNMTPELSIGSKIVVMFIMFIGRVGTITLMVAFIRKASTLNYKYPKENIFIN
jgi:trk system potassium uptake protein